MYQQARQNNEAWHIHPSFLTLPEKETGMP
jgi:hypothetical protein